MLNAKIWQNCVNKEIKKACKVLVVEIPASAAQMFVIMDLIFKRDITGHGGKFRNTYIIHISKFMIKRY